MTKSMRSLARLLTLFAWVFLAPYLLGTAARWVTYGFERTESGQTMFWIAVGAWVAALAIRMIWRKEPSQ